jgi:hypothetical protein
MGVAFCANNEQYGDLLHIQRFLWQKAKATNKSSLVTPAIIHDE